MKIISSQKGFTLIEMIVSLGIFTVVALVAIGSLVRITDANKKSITLKTTINNLNFALESLSREMRVGDGYYCSSGAIGSISSASSNACPSSVQTANSIGGWTIAFRSSKRYSSGGINCNLIYAYRYLDGTITKGEQSDCQDTIEASEFNLLISTDIIITDTIVNVITGDAPKAFFWFKGYSGVREKEKTEFEVQTSVSQRIGTN
jgi:prepilin-type N-terminal cleavage/methylation domain-containing protein